MGERRLRILEDLLPDGVDILGVDEHTAAIFDLDSGTVSIRGRGVLTLRRRGRSQRFESGTTMAIGDLAGARLAPARNGTPAAGDPDPGAATELAPPPGVESPFLQEVSNQSAAADNALASRDVDAAVSAVLAIDTQMHDWSSDTLDSDEQDRAREVLRRYVVRLGDLARNGGADPSDLIAPVVDGILALRVQMRSAGEYALADRLRDVLVEAGIEVRDAPEGSTWVLAGAPTPG
jgi:hypothetical protein